METGTDKRSRSRRGAPLSLGGTTAVAALTVKIIFLGIIAAIAVALGPALFISGNWVMFLGLAVVTVALFIIYTTKRAIPAKYLFPGTALLCIFIVVPILFTVQISTTNYGDGTRTGKAETIERIVSTSVVQSENSTIYSMSLVTTGSLTDGPFSLLLVHPETGVVSVGDQEGLRELDAADVTLEGGKIVAVDGYTLLSAKQANAAGDAVTSLAVPLGDGTTAIRPSGLTTAFEGRATIFFDEDAGSLVNLATGTTYHVETVGDREYFFDENGVRAFDQSWKASVGFDNYASLLTDPTIRQSLLQTFAWTLFFALFSVGATFFVGLFIAVVFNDVRMRGARVYRSLMIIPYAIPTFIGFLVWSTFYNKDFGLINQVFGLSIDWMGDATWAKIAICIANLWAGIPYMFLISTGALQSVPEEVAEAAAIDGAGPVRTFAKIKFPLLLISVAPLLVSSFAYNFNNFNAIRLMTGGGPFKGDGAVFGGTDILISGIYRLAFGGEGARFGLAAAVSVLLFIITGVMAAMQFRYTKALEDVQ